MEKNEKDEFINEILEKFQILLEQYFIRRDFPSIKHNEIKENTALFLEHYISLVEYVENAKEENFSKINLEVLENDFIKELMTSRVDTPSTKSKFTKIFENLQKTEAFVNFLTRMFNFYISENLKVEDYIEINGRQSRKYNRAWRSAILLREYYMKGEDLASIGLYSEDVHTTGSSEYQHKFLQDRLYLIKNLSPLLFGIDALNVF